MLSSSSTEGELILLQTNTKQIARIWQLGTQQSATFLNEITLNVVLFTAPAVQQ